MLTDTKLDFHNVLIQPISHVSNIKSRGEVDLIRKRRVKHTETRLEAVPIIAANMDTVGTFGMAEVLARHGAMTAIHKHYSAADLIKGWVRLVSLGYDDKVFYSLGITENDFNKLASVSVHVKIKNICIDVANGYMKSFHEFVARIRETYPDAVIMAGNVIDPKTAIEIVERGADIVKVGIGGGSVCTTRKETGIGLPQLSAILETADAIDSVGGLLCSDGGCQVTGDIAKAFVAGADFVMLGGMLAGHTEGAANTNGVTVFRGMSSADVMMQYEGKIADHRCAEGKQVIIEARGSVENTLKHIYGGLRSTCSYCDALFLDNLSQNAKLIRVTQQLNNLYGTA